MQWSEEVAPTLAISSLGCNGRGEIDTIRSLQVQDWAKVDEVEGSLVMMVNDSYDIVGLVVTI